MSASRILPQDRAVFAGSYRGKAGTATSLFEYAGPQLTNIVGNMYELTRRREERRQEMWQLVQKRVQEIERQQREEKQRMRHFGD